MVLERGSGSPPLRPGGPPGFPAAKSPGWPSCASAVNPWAPNNPWASPWPAGALPSVDFITLKLDGLEIGCYRFQGGTLPHELHIIIPRAEIERRGRSPDGSEHIRRTVLSSITVAHAPRYPAGSDVSPVSPAPLGQPPARSAQSAQPALPGGLTRPYSATPAAASPSD